MASLPYHGPNRSHQDVAPTEVFVRGIFKDKVALVTGGGSGIGRAVCEELGLLGAKVSFCGRKEERLSATAKELAALGIECHFCVCDIRSMESTQNLIKEVLQRWGRLDILVNNAGGQFAAVAEAISPKGFEAVIRNNLVGTWNMIHAAATMAMIPNQSGRIVNITANVARGFPTMVHTGAARAGVENLTKTLAVEWSRFNIAVNAVAPGVVTSSGTLSNYGDEEFGVTLLESAAKATPMQRTASVKEIARAVTCLASDRVMSYMTGHIVYVDGGQSLWGDVFTGPQNRDNVHPTNMSIFSKL